jgi:hypothetical protein
MGDGQLGFFPPNSSSKFGYIQDIKVGKKNRILQDSWPPTETSHKNLAI